MPKKIPKTKPTSKRSPKAGKVVTEYKAHECWLIPFRGAMIALGLSLIAMGGLLDPFIANSFVISLFLQGMGAFITIFFLAELVKELLRTNGTFFQQILSIQNPP